MWDSWLPYCGFFFMSLMSNTFFWVVSMFFLLMVVQQLIWSWCVSERRWAQGPSTLPFCLQASWLHIGIYRYRISPVSLRVLLDSSGVGANWEASAGVQRRNCKAPKSGGNGAWWLSSLEHCFVDFLLTQLDWSLLLNSFCWVFEGTFLLLVGQCLTSVPGGHTVCIQQYWLFLP